jgi:hypothetical protein
MRWRETFKKAKHPGRWSDGSRLQTVQGDFTKCQEEELHIFFPLPPSYSAYRFCLFLLRLPLHWF